MEKFLISLPRSKGTKRKTFVSEEKYANSKINKGCNGGKREGGNQMFLDLGQKSFGASKHCAVCGMFYVIGDYEDEKRHQSFCAKVNNTKFTSHTLLNQSFNMIHILLFLIHNSCTGLGLRSRRLDLLCRR